MEPIVLNKFTATGIAIGRQCGKFIEGNRTTKNFQIHQILYTLYICYDYSVPFILCFLNTFDHFLINMSNAFNGTVNNLW